MLVGILVLLLVGLVFVACGEDDPSSGPDNQLAQVIPTLTTTPEPTPIPTPPCANRGMRRY